MKKDLLEAYQEKMADLLKESETYKEINTHLRNVFTRISTQRVEMEKHMKKLLSIKI